MQGSSGLLLTTSSPHPSAPCPSSYHDPLFHWAHSTKCKLRKKEKSCFIPLSAWAMYGSFKTQNHKQGVENNLNSNFPGRMCQVQVTYQTKTRVNRVSWETRGLRGVAWHTNNYHSSLHSLPWPQIPSFVQTNWLDPRSVCLALLACWKGLEGSGECPLQWAQPMGKEQITCCGQTMSLPKHFKTHW